MCTPRKFLLRTVLSELDRRLAELMFRKRRGVFVREFRGGTLGRVGLNTITNLPQQRIGVNPVVSIVHQPLNKLLYELLPECSVLNDPGLRTSIGYLTPEKRYLEWVFDPGIDNITEIDKIITAIKMYGIPFMESHTSLESITRELERRQFIDIEGKRFLLPIAYLLSGHREKAIEFVDKQLVEIEGRSDIVAAEYRALAKALKAHPSN